MVLTLAEPQPPVAQPPTCWDTRLVVVCADDRPALTAGAAALATTLEHHPDTPLLEIAATQAAEWHSSGARLAIVASSTADLHAKLNRATARLSDLRHKQIRDTNGIYYFSQPLVSEGTIALMFPGEGAQSLNMLADLCGIFSEVEETFAWCDQLAAESGTASLRHIVHLPPHATTEQRAAAEAALRELGPSIFSVLLADLAIYRILEKLRVPAAAMAGHSAGELGALIASGAMGSVPGDRKGLPEILDLMQRQEAEAGGSNVALLAVGASRAAVEQAATAVAGSAVIVAMDNCPHQCVVVGPTHLIAAVESALTERGVICERLPFRRPYHTPLFEPYMGAFRELFAHIPFHPPHTPVYCCSTSELFPSDPAAIRELAVNQWVRPVEFTRLVERMYADGVRLFVECGPRGNLSAFIEDILRGKSFAAIPANVPRKSGPTQINHMVGQLAAHGVELNLAVLFDDNSTNHEPRPIRSKLQANGSPDNVLMHTYFDVMEQFLDTQREVMTTFFLSSRTDATLPPAIVASPDFIVSVAESTSPRLALVGEILHHSPGRDIVFRRLMDSREDLYADDHTLGGRGVSREDPQQNGLPVLPMTFSLEAMAEAASLLAPGKQIIAIRNVRLFRWLPFDPIPTTLEVRAVVWTADPATGIVEVKADVRDRGNTFLADGANKVASEAIVVLADAYPAPPDPLPFVLTDEAPCKSTVENLRRNMFHGPRFQMIRTLDRTGREGIEGTLEVKPRDGWFRSNPEPHVVLDPVLMDAAMHILGAWHLEQPDWTGRILLPFEVQQIAFFGPTPPVGSHLVVRGHNEQESARHYRHGLEVFAPDGRLWLRMTGAGYWRFYLPFGHVNFFGPKDEYFLSRDWTDVVWRGNGVAARCHFLEPPVDLKQPVLRAAGARVTLTPRELEQFWKWSGTDAELNDWFFARLLVKDAVRAVWKMKYGEAMFPADMETDEVNGQFVCRPRGTAKDEPFPPVSVAIAGNTVAAFSAFAQRVGIALVELPKNASAATEHAARVAAARRALANALQIPETDCTLESFSGPPGAAIVTAQGQRFGVQTARRQDVVGATTTCETV